VLGGGCERWGRCGSRRGGCLWGRGRAARARRGSTPVYSFMLTLADRATREYIEAEHCHETRELKRIACRARSTRGALVRRGALASRLEPVVRLVQSMCARLPVRRAVRSATVFGHGWVDAALGSGHVRSLVEELQSRPSGGCHCVAYSASTMNGLPFSTTYVASSAAVPLPTFLTEWTVSAGTIKASPALYVFGGWPSMEYSGIPFST